MGCGWLTIVRLAKVTTVRLAKVTLVCLKGTVLMIRIVQLVNGLRLSNKWPVDQHIYFSYCTYFNVGALFVNGHRLASIGYVHEWDVVAPRFLYQNGELSLASSTGKAGTVRTPPLTSSYPGQAQSCPFVNM